MNELGLMERFANPELFKGLAFGEKMAAGGVTLLMGMGMTFLILCIIWACIAIMGKIMNAGEKKKTAQPEAAVATLKAAYDGAAPAADTKAAPAEAPADGSLDPALVAVIMAAIAASEGGTPLDNLRVTRITRVAGTKPVWGAAGLRDALDSRTW
jgi:sodium pump decarboxylase gamma subunit